MAGSRLAKVDEILIKSYRLPKELSLSFFMFEQVDLGPSRIA